jgi:hypothetical protein
MLKLIYESMCNTRYFKYSCLIITRVYIGLAVHTGTGNALHSFVIAKNIQTSIPRQWM